MLRFGTTIKLKKKSFCGWGLLGLVFSNDGSNSERLGAFTKRWKHRYWWNYSHCVIATNRAMFYLKFFKFWILRRIERHLAAGRVTKIRHVAAKPWLTFWKVSGEFKTRMCRCDGRSLVPMDGYNFIDFAYCLKCLNKNIKFKSNLIAWSRQSCEVK